MALHYLPIGARISDSLVEMLKSATAQGLAESPGALPSLCLEERRYYKNSGPAVAGNERMDFAVRLRCAPVNRIAEERSPILVRERFWVIRFDRKNWPKHMTFVLDGLEVHIDKEEQRELNGTRLDFVDGKIIVTFDAAGC